MLPYVLSITLTSGFAWLYQSFKDIPPRNFVLQVLRRLAPSFFILSIVPLLLLSAFRVGVGVDFNSYADWFDNLYDYDYAYFEPGFTAMIRFIQLFTLDSQWLFIVSSLITLTLIFVSTRRYSPMFALSIFLFCTMGFFSHSLNLTRQFIAVAIILFSYGYIVDRKLFKYILSVIVASLFHQTALLMLPAYHLLRLRPRLTGWFIVGLISIALTAFRSKITTFVVDNFYPQYYDSSFIGETISSTYYVIIGIVSVGTAIFFVYKKKLNLDIVKNRILMNLVLIVALLHIILSWVPLSNRVSLYFDIMMIIIIPQLVVLVDGVLRRRIILAVIAGYFMLAAYLSFSSNANGVLPYRSSLFSYTTNYITKLGV